jgi:two-component system, NarL family, response regulator DegU
MRRIRIVIADDHPIFTRGLRQVLTSDSDLDVVAEARDGESALECIQEHRPDVVILDIDMPKKDGFEVVRAMGDRKLSAAVVFLTMHKNEALLNGALDLGVRGYVLKDSALAEVADSVKAVAAGHNFVSPVLAAYLFGRRVRAQGLMKEQSGLKNLTPAERGVLLRIAAGKNTSEIAQELYLSVRTIEHHRAHIAGKLNLHGRDALLRFAIANKSELS